MRVERAVWLLPDGSTQYTKLSDEFRLNKRTFPQTKTWEEYAKFSLDKEAKAIPQGRVAGFIPEEEYQRTFAAHRQFRAAWTWTTLEPVIDFDLGKCRKITKTLLGRDDPAIEAAATPEALKTILLDALKGVK